MGNGKSGGFSAGPKGVIKNNVKVKGNAMGKKLKGDHSDEDPAGSGRVFVRGFDFDTSDDQLKGHMSQAGPVHAIHFVSKGSANIVYKKKASVAKACSNLGKTTIDGNSRYIEVSAKN